MFRVKKFLFCLKIELAGYMCVLNDISISILSILIANDSLQSSVHVRDQLPEIRKLLQWIVFLFSTAAVFSSFLAFLGTFRVNSLLQIEIKSKNFFKSFQKSATLINAYLGYMPLSYYCQLWFFCLIQCKIGLFFITIYNLYLFLCLCSIYDKFWNIKQLRAPKRQNLQLSTIYAEKRRSMTHQHLQDL
jgi:hypothetical protein